ncbi:MAG: SHOCT domain-containing protein [Candidatus Limnocylindria bacterium]
MAQTASVGIARSRPEKARLARRIAWLCVALYAAFALTAVAIGQPAGPEPILDVLVVVGLFGSALVGALIVGSEPNHRIGWMFLGLALSFGLSFFAQGYAIKALVLSPGSLPAGEAMAWLGFWIDLPAVAVFALFLPLLFPDGHLPSRSWRPVAWVAAAAVLVFIVAKMFGPGRYENFPAIRNPLGLEGQRAFFEALGVAIDPLLLVLVILSAAALFSRVRLADAEQRQQIKWFAYAGALVLVSFLLGPLTAAFPSLAAIREVAVVVALVAVPAAVGVAILRYRLYDIDLIINRTVVYVLLTAVLAGVYTAAVALFQRLFVAMSGQSSDIAIVMTLFVLATVFTPIKNTLQGAVDRRIKPTPRPVATHSTSIDDLLMLSELHDRGVLTDEEFAAKKKQVLGI